MSICIAQCMGGVVLSKGVRVVKVLIASHREVSTYGFASDWNAHAAGVCVVSMVSFQEDTK